MPTDNAEERVIQGNQAGCLAADQTVVTSPRRPGDPDRRRDRADRCHCLRSNRGAYHRPEGIVAAPAERQVHLPSRAGIVVRMVMPMKS